MSDCSFKRERGGASRGWMVQWANQRAARGSFKRRRGSGRTNQRVFGGSGGGARAPAASDADALQELQSSGLERGAEVRGGGRDPPGAARQGLPPPAGASGPDRLQRSARPAGEGEKLSCPEERQASRQGGMGAAVPEGPHSSFSPPRSDLPPPAGSASTGTVLS